MKGMAAVVQPDKLFSREFLALNGISFLIICNMAVFFQFYLYLYTLPIAPAWFGFLIAVFSVTGLILRPFISPFLHAGNARWWIFAGAAGVIISLFGYNLAAGLWTMSLVRAVHGIAYALLGIAVNASMVGLIPPAKSGQAFGLITVVMLLPFAVVPPVLGVATRLLGGFVSVLNLSAVLMLLIFPLALLVKAPPGGQTDPSGRRPGMADLAENLKDRRIVALLLVMLLLYSGYTPVFFFLEGYAQKIEIANPGLFFTLSTFSEIGVRLLAGSLFDRVSKVRLATGSLAAVGLGYIALAHLSGQVLFYALGIFLGLGWGVVMPVLNALMFDISPAHLKGLNTNLGVQMFQGGFFVGPFIGGLALSHGDYRFLYYLCAGLTFGAIALMPFLAGQSVKLKQGHGVGQINN